MIKSILFIGAFFFSFYSLSQLITYQSQTKSKISFDTSTYIYFDTDIISSFRSLAPNEAHLNTPLGIRSDESRLICSSFTIGISLPLNQFIKVNSGLSFIQNGEAYNWSSSINDSTYNYNSKYRYIGLPISLSTAYGKKLKLHISAGIIPGIFSSYRQQLDWTDADGSEYDEEIKIQNDLNFFNLAAQGSLGIEYFFKAFSFRMSCIYRQQLNNTYKEFEDYIHKSNGMGGRLTLTYFL